MLYFIIFIFAFAAISCEPADGPPVDNIVVETNGRAGDLEEVPGSSGLDGKADMTVEGLEPDKLEKGTTLPPDTSGQVKAHFINVGQGDSILVQTPEQNILIDAGGRNAGADVVEYLRNHGVSSLDLVVGTHPHEDHLGGLIEVLNIIPVKEVIDPAVAHTTKTFEDYLTLIDEKDIIFTEGRAGMKRDLGGGAVLEILPPRKRDYQCRHLFFYANDL